MPLRFSSYKGQYAGDDNVGSPLFLCWVNPTGTRFCKRCIARNGQTYERPANKGPRCKNKTCKLSNFCLLHLKSIMNLEIKESEALNSIGISGVGLYAYGGRNYNEAKEGPVFHEGRPHIAYYGGQMLTNQQLSDRYDYYSADANRNQPPNIEPTAPYGGAIESDDQHKMDAACRRKAAVYANAPHHIPHREANAVLEFSQYNSRLVLHEGDEIKHGQEILVLYDDEYWTGQGEEFLTYNTKTKYRDMRRYPPDSDDDDDE